MRVLFAFLLYIIHFVYILSTKTRLVWKYFSSTIPKPLQAPRRRIPKHLAVVFIIGPNIYADNVQTALIEGALKIIEWCQVTGITKLTLYEEHDRLSKCVPNLQEHTCHAVTLCLVSRQSAKPEIASVAQSLAQAQVQIRNRTPPKANHSRTSDTFQLSIDQLDELLENEDGLSSPDFMIVQPLNLDSSSTTAIELHGFSPWHIRLTEIYQNRKLLGFWFGKGGSSESYFSPPLDEFSFREALDEFDSAEMRLGK